MQIVKVNDARNGYRPSNEPSAKNWEYSLLWHSGATKEKSIQGPFTVLNRALPGGVYPAIRVTSGTMEYYIITGNFICNGEQYLAGDYVLFEEGEMMKWSSEGGGEMFIVLKGTLEWFNTIVGS